MPVGLYDLDYGYRPDFNTPYKAFATGMEKSATEQYRNLMAQKMAYDMLEDRRRWQDQFDAGRADKAEYNKYLEAQMEKWKSDQNALRQAQAQEKGRESLYPALKTISDLTASAVQKGDMGKLSRAAQLYNQLESVVGERAPEIAALLNKPSTFVNADTKEQIQSKLDPEVLPSIMANFTKPKDVSNLELEALKQSGRMDIADKRAELALQLQSMKNAAAKAAIQAKNSRDPRTFQEAATRMAQLYYMTGEEQYAQQANEYMQMAQALVPQQLQQGITPEGIGNVPRNAPRPIPQLTPPTQAPAAQPQAAPTAKPVQKRKPLSEY